MNSLGQYKHLRLKKATLALLIRKNQYNESPSDNTIQKTANSKDQQLEMLYNHREQQLVMTCENCMLFEDGRSLSIFTS